VEHEDRLVASEDGVQTSARLLAGLGGDRLPDRAVGGA
jgi:hypothetical protein